MKISKNLSMLEMISFILVIVGTVLNYTAVDSIILKIALFALSIIFFVRVFTISNNIQNTDNEVNENEKLGFSDLLALNILPKVLWISSAILNTGILLYLLEVKGYKAMLGNGASSAGLSMVILIILSIKGTRNININYPILLRTIPVLLAAIYILFK